MRDYRLFFFNGEGRFLKVHEFAANGDEHAIRISEAWREGRGMELWHRDRRVQRWECE